MSAIGKYRIIKRIGVGGLADVYLGHPSDGLPTGLVALKRLRRRWRKRPDLVQLFTTEADVGRLLRHENIVRTYDVVLDDNSTLTIVMEYVGGRTLRDVLERLGDQNLLAHEVSLHIVSELLTALHYAHELKGNTGLPLELVHRDVAPDNVFITFDGQVKLSDFGIAHLNALDGDSAGRGSFGKIPYMAAEQLLEKTVDRRTDIYAAGVILYELLTGRHPFQIDGEKGNDNKLITRIITGRHRRMRAHIPSMDAALEALVDAAIATSAGDRGETAAQMAMAIAPFYRSQANWTPILQGLMAQLFAAEREVHVQIMAQSASLA